MGTALVTVISDPSTDAIAVFPFAFGGSPDYAYVSRGLSQLLSNKLDGTVGIRSVDPRAILARIGDRAGTSLDLNESLQVAEDLGARLAVLGSVIEIGGRAQIAATLYRLGGRDRTEYQASVEGDITGVFDLVDDLAVQLMTQIPEYGPSNVDRIASISTSSVEALRPYLDGEQAYRDGRFEQAAAAFRRAINVDSTFALAHYKLALTGEWIGYGPRERERLAEAALDLSDRLPDQERQLISAYLSGITGKASDAEERYRRLLRFYPTNVEAWARLGDQLFHTGPQIGKSAFESEHAFERTLDLEPRNTEAMVHLIRLAVLDGRLNRADSLAQLIARLNPETIQMLESHVLIIFAHGDTLAQRRLYEDVINGVLSPDGVGRGLERVPTWTPLGVCCRNILLPPERMVNMLPEIRRPRIVLSNRIWFGDWYGLIEDLRRMESTEGIGERRANLILSGLASAGELGEVEELLAGLRQIKTSTENSSDGLDRTDTFYQHAYARFLIGVVAADNGDTATAGREQAWLAQLQDPFSTGSFLSDLAFLLDALILRADGDNTGALQSLQKVAGEIVPLRVDYTYVLHASHLIRAELLAEQGQYDGALAALNSRWGQQRMRDIRPKLLYQYGTVYEQARDTVQAIKYLEAFTSEWENATGPWKGWLEDAESRLARLKAVD